MESFFYVNGKGFFPFSHFRWFDTKTKQKAKKERGDKSNKETIPMVQYPPFIVFAMIPIHQAEEWKRE